MLPDTAPLDNRTTMGQRDSVTWDLDPFLFHGGSVPLRYYGLIFAVTIVAGFFLWRWQMRRGGHPEQKTAAFLAYGIVGTVAGARLVHCLFYDLYRFLASHGLYLLQVWRGGLSSHGATVGLLLALVIFARRNAVPIAEATDRFSFAAALGACTIRVANFVNSEIVGRPTDGTWGVRFPRYDRGLPLSQVPLRHPSQLYEAALGLLVLASLLAVDRFRGEQRRRGLLSALFLTLYFSGRVVLELYKEHQALASDAPLTMGQILSLPPLLGGVVWLVLLKARSRQTS